MLKLSSIQEIRDWVAQTDADITYSGKPIDFGDLSKYNALDTTVVFCNRVTGTLCGGVCGVYSGGPVCLHTPGTACLAATSNVVFCSGTNCTGTCNHFADCATVATALPNDYCSTPGVQSILVTT